MTHSANAVIIGAGIAGVSTAYSLTVDRRFKRVFLVDPRPPLTLTSDKSTESYRNWWPDQPMVSLMNRSIDALDVLAHLSHDAFGLNRRGYLFVTAEDETFNLLASQARRTAELGAEADVLDRNDVTIEYPYLAEDVVGAVRVKRAGWFDAQQLGAWMLDRARSAGTELVGQQVDDVTVGNDGVSGVTLDNGDVISSKVVVDAAGPMASQVAAMAGVDLPLHSELHLKVVFKDHRAAVPRNAPMLIWSDPQTIEWSETELEALVDAGRRDLVDELPVFCHGRPEGGADSPYVVGLWEYDRKVMEPEWPIPVDDMYAEVVLRGLSRMIPGLAVYRDGLPETAIDGGYYTKTPENRPLIGPGGPDGFYVIAGLSGFGVMVAAGAADLLADHITGSEIADYSSSFMVSRYDDDAYTAAMDAHDSGQL